MWEEIYIWIESYAGCSYDVDKELEFIKDNDKPFTETIEWKLVNEQLIDQLSEIFDIINEYGSLIPDNLPDEDKMKQAFASKILLGMLEGINGVKRQLHIQQVDINDYNVLLKHVDVLFDLISMMKENNLDTIIEKGMFDKYNEENEDDFTDLLGLTSSDVSNIYYTIASVNEDDEDEDEVPSDLVD